MQQVLTFTTVFETCSFLNNVGTLLQTLQVLLLISALLQNFLGLILAALE